MEIPGLASKAIGFGTNPQNRKKYNGIEFDSDLDLNINEAFYRNLDPQTGRFWQVDPTIDGYENISPYASMYNNPVKISDPLGDEGDDCCKALWNAVVDAGTQVLSASAGALNAWSSDQLLGAGHVSNINESGASYGTQVAYIVGNKIGHAAAIVTGVVEDVVAGGGELASVGLATPLAVPLAVHGTSVIVTAGMNLIKGSPAPNGNNSNNQDAGTRRQNRLPDKADPNSTQTNKPGTTTKKYGPDGNVQKEYNKGHTGNNVPKKEQKDHVHDYKPNSNNPSGRGDRQPGRAPKKNELKKDFGS